MSSFVTLPTRLAAQWGTSAAPAESLHVTIAVSGVTDPGGAKCKVNQDTFFTHCDAANGAMVIGVFDGHGKEAGRDAAFAARDYFKAHFQSMTQQDYQEMEQSPQQEFSNMFNGCHSDMRSILKAVYERRGFTVQEQDGYMVKFPTGIEATQQQQLYSCVRGGTTATIVVILDGGRKILSASVGDSAVAIGAKCAVCMKQSDVLELHEEAAGPEAAGKSDHTATKPNRKASSTTKLLMLTGDHSPDNQREFFRAREFRRSDSDHDMPGLRFLFDTGDPRMKRKPIFQVDPKGELMQKHTGNYLKNVRDEWATLVATPADSPFPDSLAFTRSLGDFHMHAYGVSCEPSVRELSLEQIAQRVLQHGSSRGNQDEEDDDEELEAASASNTESDDNNSETSCNDCNGHGGALEFTLVAASDGVWDNWKFHDLFAFLDSSDAKRTRARSTSSTSSSAKSDVAGGDEAPEAYPVDNAVAMLLKANLKLAQRVFGDDADNMTAVLCHFRVSS